LIQTYLTESKRRVRHSESTPANARHGLPHPARAVIRPGGRRRDAALLATPSVSGPEHAADTIAGMLPDGFSWTNRHQYAEGELALLCGQHQVAMLMRRADGRWMARLWAHRPITEPLVARQCSSFDSGKAGIEAWAARHRDRICAETSAGRSALP